MKNDSTIPRDSLYEQLDLADGYGTTYLVNRSPFEAIEAQFGLSKDEVIDFMRRNLKVKSFRGWRRRVSGRETKHRKLREEEVNRFVSPAQTSKYQ